MSRSATNDFTLQAPAKINLFLHITGKRADGYHLLQSLMVFVDVGDEMEFSPHDGMLLDIEGPFALDMADDPHGNLVYKAARALAAEYRREATGRIRLRKNLPVSSGMGGGSSDAATALKGLARLWRLPEEQDRLMRVAERLGADVPPCLMRRPVWAEGTGEKMTPLIGMPEMYFVLLNPMVPTLTTEVFKRYQPRFSGPLQFTGRRKTMQEWISDIKLYRNDLTDAAIEVTPVIRDALASLGQTPNCHLSRVSGSGATCFGVYDRPEAAAAAVNKLRLKHPDWWVAAANLMKG